MTEKTGVTPGHHSAEQLPRPEPSHADVSERLLMEFGPRHGLRRVSELLRRCRVQLSADPTPSSPQALERLARSMLATTPVPRPRRQRP